MAEQIKHEAEAVPAVADLRKYIEIRVDQEHPDIKRPYIRERRVPVATIAHSSRSQRWGVGELAYQFTLSETQVLAALLYYAEHQGEIETHESAYQTLLDEAYRLYGNKD